MQYGGDFNSTALALFQWQIQNNPEYGRICGSTRPTRWQEIPAAPAALFRDLSLCSFPSFFAKQIFLTSGTTGKRGAHRLQDTELYDLGATMHMQRCVGGVPAKSISFVSTSGDSSLGHMCRLFSPRHQHFFITGVGLLKKEAIQALLENEEPIFVPGTAFAFAELLADRTAPIPLPKGSVVMVTGGFKGRKSTITAETLIEKLGAVFVGAKIVSEYGMTELSSQLWSTSNDGRFIPPPWMRVLAVEPETGRPTTGCGQLRFFDLANHQTVMAIETRDQGIVYPDGSVQLMGRLPKAKPRGCSLTVEETLEAPKHHIQSKRYTGKKPLSVAAAKRLLQTLHRLKEHTLTPYAQGLSEANAQWGLNEALGALSVTGVQEVLAQQTVYPKTVSIVVSYGVFCSVLEWVFLALCAGAQVTLKAPNLDPSFCMLLCELLQAEGFSIQCTTDRALPQSELIYVFGSTETVEQITAAYPQSTVKGYGHRLSIIVCEGSPHEAPLIASDLVAYDTRGCMSPTAIFCLNPPEHLKGALHIALSELAQSRPLGATDPLMGPEHRYQQSLAKASGSFSQHGTHSIRILPASFWSPVALPRVASLHQLSSVSQLKFLLRSYEDQLSTLGHSIEIPDAIRCLFPRTCKLGELQRPPFPREHDGYPMLD